MCFRKRHPNRRDELIYSIHRTECHMAAFDDALAALDAKVDAVLAKLAGDDAAVAAAQQAAAEAEARAQEVVDNDAAEDAAADQARADALSSVNAKWPR